MKIAYNVQLSVPISENEKKIASRTLLAFKRSNMLLDEAVSYLNVLKNPMTEDRPDKDTIWKTRADLRSKRDMALKKFNKFKVIALKSVFLMKALGYDTNIIKLTKSFISIVESLEDSVNAFIDLFDNLSSDTFVDDILKKINDIDNKSKKVIEVTENRIKTHIQEHILQSTWLNTVDNEENIADLNNQLGAKNVF